MSTPRSLQLTRGTETVFFTGTGPVILTGAGPMSLVVEKGEGSRGDIQIKGMDSGSLTLFSGEWDDVLSEYAKACEHLGRQRPEDAASKRSQANGLWDRPWMLPLALLVVLPLYAFGGAAAVSYGDKLFGHDADKPAQGREQPAPQVGALPGGVLNIPGAQEAIERAMKEAAAKPGQGAHLPPIQQLPDFLKVPVPDASAGPEKSPATDSQPPAASAPTDKAPETEKPKTASAPDKPAAPVVSGSGLPAYGTPQAAKPVSEPEASAEATRNETVEPATPAESPVADVASPAEAAKPLADSKQASPLEAKENAQNAVQSMLSRGMTPQQASDVLQKLEALGRTDFSEITPAMIAELPHEVAQILIENGLVNRDELDAPGGVPYSIIRLPESVIDQYRGKDGIASIPERNSWASTGNNVSIPLPGGGDVKVPDDLKDFKLKP